MHIKSIRQYHLFLLLVLINIAAFYAFVGHSLLETDNSKDINYLITTSAAIVITWFAYYLLRHKLTSKRLVWTHILFIATSVLIVPSIAIDFAPTPRRYLELNSQGFKLADIFGNMTIAVVVQIILFVTSLIFILLNVRGNKN